MADLDGALHFQRLGAFGARLPSGDGAEVKPLGHFDVALDRDAAEMEAILVRTGGHVVRSAQPFVGEYLHRGRDVEDRAERTGLRAEGGRAFLRRRRTGGERAGAGEELGLVQLVVSANQDEDQLAIGDIHERLDLAVRRHAVRSLTQGLDGDNAGSGELLNARANFTRRGLRNSAGSFLDVRRVAARLAVNHLVLASHRRHHELMRVVAADDASVGLDREVAQAAAVEDARVGVIHPLVAGHRALVAGVEGIGVLHDEFLRAHEAEARADFVAELHADLVEVHRHLPVGIEFARCQRGDDLLGGGAENPLLVRAVLRLVKHIAGGLVAARLPPDVGGLECGHEHFDRPRAVHFLADEILDLAQHAQAERQERVEAAGELAHEASAKEQLVREDFRVGRGFLEGWDEIL